MGLKDKVRDQASQFAQKTQEAAQQGKAKLDEVQANRRADAMLQQLGALVYAERSAGRTADSQAKIDKQISDISVFEQENGLNLADRAKPTVPQPGSPPDKDASASSLWPHQASDPILGLKLAAQHVSANTSGQASRCVARS